ncbi:hypothetical protein CHINAEXTREME_09860 [Halobiforma lacisalsi AJ5]|uniref:Uncharacterized protein n=1 Tax=Natronobacterium lacisalsi AJ5 TaxID=358396 RepID=M0L4X1_NATLA|nr:hypothetical protein [Halobiforma lacisalsi]APW98071.1 hypothetical protein CHINAEXTREME_09860 [Halobiforma lacisalsi AJ5]EMA28627.1 hypothetical protein C445_18431 [Halobiforma lacisalsi AJ5]
MGYTDDFVNAVRRSFLPQLHYLFRGTFGGYAVSHTTADEYVLTAHCTEDTLEDVLDELGFSRNPIASLKVRLDGNTSEGSWVWRASPLASNQLHVVLHDLEGAEGVDVYAHWECSWIRHPYKHYVTRGYDAEIGVALARRWLVNLDGDGLEAADGIAYEIDDSLARRVSEYLSLSYYRGIEAVGSLRSRVPVLEDSQDTLTIDREDERDDVSPRIAEF